ncbi:MAG: D-alanyl-D-alanine carboxypeptidase/D-alanyl-D-alanine-endopeptidase [Planctomycetota bacterium]|nr:D-alanyl-D-alanine carboxypeptidase/D-alanyl-D-alanine-endopeptidase [Planctomycetota bacterium]
MRILQYLLLLSLFTTSQAIADLQAEVEQIVRSASLNKGHASVHIIDTESNATLASHHSSKMMIPASNQKLLTTGATLHVLGPTFHFETKLVRDGSDIHIVGDGDPTFGDMELHPELEGTSERAFLNTELEEWVYAIQKSGLSKIDTLFINDSIFDQNFVHPTWPADQINNWYCAQVAGVNYHLNVIHFYPSPRSGTRASLGTVSPAFDWLTINNRTSSKTGKNDKSSFWVARLPNSNEMTARGNVKATHKEPVKIAFHDPPMVFAKSLASKLQKSGVKVNAVKRTDSTPSCTIIFTKRTPLSTALMRANVDSHNMYAEALIKRIAAATGTQGSFEKGSEIVERAVSQRIGNSNHLSVADGSGMSRKNQINTKTLCKWLASFNLNEPAGKMLLDSLATPGEGTLRSRFNTFKFDGVQVHAKSGYLNGVSTLSGYITFKERAPVAFSIFVNDVKGTVKGAKNMHEALVLATIHSLN